MASFTELVELMAYMRGGEGCPWDRQQTIGDFSVHLKNESQEALTAIEEGDYDNLREELGDLLWHIIFISQIAKEEGYFTLEDVMATLKDKIIRRHPHVFKEKKDLTADEVSILWGQIKEGEKAQR